MILQESGEMYLETILQLQQKQGKVRAIDVAEQMNFTKASVSRAMSILKRQFPQKQLSVRPVFRFWL